MYLEIQLPSVVMHFFLIKQDSEFTATNTLNQELRCNTVLMEELKKNINLCSEGLFKDVYLRL